MTIYSEEIIRNAVTKDVMAQYYLAPFGDKIGVYVDGSVLINQDAGNEIAPNERPIAIAKVPGIGNINKSFFTEGWATEHEYGYRTNDGRIISLEEAIIECCKDGDISEEIEELVQELINSL